MSSNDLPLDGVVVLDLGQIYQGPYAGFLAAKAGVTTGEWGETIRQAFGQYRAPTGVSRAPSNRTDFVTGRSRNGAVGSPDNADQSANLTTSPVRSPYPADQSKPDSFCGYRPVLRHREPRP